MIRLAFPVLATVIAIYLYLRRPLAYVGFTLWIWFLTPLLRRLVDYQLGWAEPNLLLLAPFLVASVGALTIIHPRRDAPLDIPPTFILCFIAIAYGFLVALDLHPSGESVYALFNWAAPLIFALHLLLHWRNYPSIRNTLERNIVAGVAAMGAYGVYQFFIAPSWDTYWLRNISIGLIDPSFGQPKPMGIRVWSTLNAPGPFASVMMACLLTLFVTKSRFKLIASVAGYGTFLLSVVRTSWLCWFVGLALLLRRERPSTILKIAASLALLVVCLIPIVQNPDIAPVLGDRLKTFTHLAKDESFRERSDMYSVVLGVVRDDPWGHGLRNQEIVHNLVVDSGLLIIVLSLGWMGATFYAAGIIAFLFTRESSTTDRFPQAMKAICIAFLFQLIGGQVFVGVIGAMFWLCLGMTLAAGRWHEANPTTPQPEVLKAQPEDEITRAFRQISTV